MSLTASFALLLILLFGCSDRTVGRSGNASPNVTPSTASSSDNPISAPATAHGPAERPTLAEAQREVLRIAREKEPKVPIQSASVVGIGKDAQGRWWIQAWTHVSPTFQGESDEQWFIVRSGTGWAYVDRGTGMQQADYPADIKWENAQ